MRAILEALKKSKKEKKDDENGKEADTVTLPALPEAKDSRVVAASGKPVKFLPWFMELDCQVPEGLGGWQQSRDFGCHDRFGDHRPSK